ncbi:MULTISPECIES: hypothetical protein [unclassified Frigoribacterium]|uniref:hypothetical protein n=1 Tax=unclassified Frigoribacterium TaxID=2627005 RepID=UPI0006FE46E4|nr:MULTISPECIES: hypothetical protein [unclassified Frigoribacterium]KQO81089.1 hypothetical protein ASF17_13280 [Frigoribacterium sp. Leaf263]KQR62927.1 hypothetical protein ASF89_13460 [Frigoribacterium sp. Leaf172]
MKGKILFVAGAAVGYVLGARAGRGAYIKIKDRAGDLWENPSVQKTVHQAEDFVKENAPVVGGKLKDVASDAASAAQSTVKSASKKAGKASDAVADKADEVTSKTSGSKGASKGSSAVGADKGSADTDDRDNGTSKLPGVSVGD